MAEKYEIKRALFLMNNSIVKKLFIVATISFSGVIYPIQESTANIATFLVAGICAGGSYRLIQEFPGSFHSGTLTGLSCAATLVAYHMLHRSTPIGRIKRANALLNEVSRHTLARTTFESDKLFFDVVQDVYLTDDLPLISAYNHLIDLIPNMHYALSLINKASAQVGRDVLLQEECDASLSRANKLFRNIGDAIKRIREHKDYLSQLTIYKESLAQEKQTIAQEQMALAQLQMAHAQQGNTVLKWLKAIIWRK
jgi:hypothetical protein